MFRQLPNYLMIGIPAPTAALVPPAILFDIHPQDIVTYMEAYWDKRLPQPPLPYPPPPTTVPPLGDPNYRSEEDALRVAPLPTTRRPLPAGQAQSLFGFSPGPPPITVPGGFLRWDHLIYAYMIENTRVYEIFRRVLHEYRHGEKFGTPLDFSTQNWLRTTEELFYSDPAPFLITNVSSHIRSDLRANRRNAYQRMFGMDLNHGTDDGKPYAYIKAEAANSEFVATFEEFLREIWIGITYVTATSSSNPTDDSKIAVLATKLHDMLRSRRQSGNLSREEFAFVSMMSWFHLTLELNPPLSIIRSLRAEADGVENRLFKIAQLVGLPAHGLSKSFFDIADPLSRLLIEIEMGLYNNAVAVRPLYDRVAFPGGPEPDLRTIITHWTAITGRDVKARKVASS
jgi:transcriptional regulator with XRE-family HTH domain